MQSSQNQQVQIFLNEIKDIDPEKFELLQILREIVFTCYPKINERMMYGGIMFSLDEDFGGLFVRKNHLSFEFSSGSSMDDPQKILEGKGQYRRHLKIRSLTDIEEKQVSFFVKQAV